MALFPLSPWPEENSCVGSPSSGWFVEVCKSCVGLSVAGTPLSIFTYKEPPSQSYQVSGSAREALSQPAELKPTQSGFSLQAFSSSSTERPSRRSKLPPPESLPACSS